MGEALRRLGVRGFKPSALKWMLAAIGAYLVFSAAYVAIFGSPHQEDIAESFGAVPVQILLIVDRGAGQRGGLLPRHALRRPAHAPAAPRRGARSARLVFGGLHALTGVSAVPPLIVFGFILALLYEKTGSIVPGIVLHMLNNSVALIGQ